MTSLGDSVEKESGSYGVEGKSPFWRKVLALARLVLSLASRTRRGVEGIRHACHRALERISHLPFPMNPHWYS